MLNKKLINFLDQKFLFENFLKIKNKIF